MNLVRDYVGRAGIKDLEIRFDRADAPGDVPMALNFSNQEGNKKAAGSGSTLAAAGCRLTTAEYCLPPRVDLDRPAGHQAADHPIVVIGCTGDDKIEVAAAETAKAAAAAAAASTGFCRRA